MQPTTRFAPSPTGQLHLGHIYSALQSHDFARAHDGVFLLRIEDIDGGRVRAEFVDGIIEDLRWAGLQWDGEVVFQSQRQALYGQALAKLRAEGLLYPCFCTRSEILAEVAASASAPHSGRTSAASTEQLIYPGTCRKLVESDLSRPHAWRLDVAGASARAGPLTWRDGECEAAARPEMFGDVVLARKDAPASYHLAVTVDDAAQGVTDVVRGRDLFDSTHVHRLLQALLDLPTPFYHHHGLLTDASGNRLAKRHLAPTVAGLRAAGIDPARLIADLRNGRLPTGYSLAEH
jgi:glutamyl-Q tRNA(Asp) synthetase